MDANTISAYAAVGAVVVSLVVLVISIVIAIFQIRAKRIDDLRAAQLARLDRQLSNLYGPLFALFTSGDKEWRAFLEKFSNSRDLGFLGFFPMNNEFDPPNEEQLRTFRIWMENILMRNNIQMEETIINNADLLVGYEMPDPFLNFCVHVSSVRYTIADWNTTEFKSTGGNRDWKRHMAIFPHPAGDFHIHVKVTFDTLKREQAILLSKKKRNLKENELAYYIKSKVNIILTIYTIIDIFHELLQHTSDEVADGKNLNQPTIMLVFLIGKLLTQIKYFENDRSITDFKKFLSDKKIDEDLQTELVSYTSKGSFLETEKFIRQRRSRSTTEFPSFLVNTISWVEKLIQDFGDAWKAVHSTDASNDRNKNHKSLSQSNIDSLSFFVKIYNSGKIRESGPDFKEFNPSNLYVNSDSIEFTKILLNLHKDLHSRLKILDPKTETIRNDKFSSWTR